jgi:hypothetical protein
MKNFLTKLDDAAYFQWNILKCKFMYLRALSKNGFKPKKIVLFYPEMPQSWHLIYPVCHILGYSMTNDPNSKFDIVVAFQDTTFRTEDQMLSDLSNKYRVINSKCGDISKERVDKVFLESFGYGLAVDPNTYQGVYVRKPNLNARHPVESFKILDKPSEPEKGFVYQRLLDNQTDKDSATDMRTFIFGNDIPFTLFRKKSIHDRFNDDTIIATRVETDKAFTKEEQAAIIRFCKAFGLDYGELDVLRNNIDGKIYIVDVNNTTSGPRPGMQITKEGYKLFLKELSESFEKMAATTI